MIRYKDCFQNIKENVNRSDNNKKKELCVHHLHLKGFKRHFSGI